MTRAPDNLLAVRALLGEHLGIKPAALGITGDAAHRGGYHCGTDRVVANDYSVVESKRDRDGLTLDACALDVGGFTVKAGGKSFDLPHFSAWCVAQCKADAPDTCDIREIIWSPDGKTVRRWDRLGKRSTGDESHRWHTHISFFRDAIKAGRDLTPLFRRYLTTIGLIAAPTKPAPEADMPLTPADKPIIREAFLEALEQRLPLPGAVGERMARIGSSWGPDVSLWMLLARVYEGVISGRPVDEQAIVSGVLAGLPAEKIAAAIPPQLVKDVVDELGRRLVQG